MKLYISQENINKGSIGDVGSCPVERAMMEAGFKGSLLEVVMLFGILKIFQEFISQTVNVFLKLLHGNFLQM